MPNPLRRLILANGEQYIRPEKKTRSSRPPEMPRTYGEARGLVKQNVQTALAQFNALPARKRLADEAVFCLRLHPSFIAKTYDPQPIFATVPDLVNIGSRSYKVPTTKVAQTERIRKQLEQHVHEVTGRLVFVRSNDAGFRLSLSVLDTPESVLKQDFKESVQRVEKFDLLSSSEQLLGFGTDWKEGRVEVILHPSRHSEAEQTDFLKLLLEG